MLIGIFYYCKYCSVKSGIYRQLVHFTKIVICLASEMLWFVSTVEAWYEDLQPDLGVNGSWRVNSLLSWALGMELGSWKIHRWGKAPTWGSSLWLLPSLPQRRRLCWRGIRHRELNKEIQDWHKTQRTCLVEEYRSDSPQVYKIIRRADKSTAWFWPVWGTLTALRKAVFPVSLQIHPLISIFWFTGQEPQEWYLVYGSYRATIRF